MLHRRLMIAAATATLAAAAALPAAAGASSTTSIEVQDRCDPTTFNAGLGEGACVRPEGDGGGAVTLDALMSNLVDHGSHSGWRFTRDAVTLRQGETLDVDMTRGGEMHSFTKVNSFGPGCVPPINAILFGSPAVGSMCGDPTLPSTFVTPGGHLEVKAVKKGTYHYMCVIHPWMKTTVTVR